MITIPTYADILAAHERIKPHIVRTPVLSGDAINALTGAEIFFKCESFQRIGAFKARGATNAVYSLDDATAKRGVVTHSSGNHGAALAWAAKRRGINAVVVVPESAPRTKIANIRRAGAEVVFCESTAAAREAAAAKLVAERGMEFVHPYDDNRVIAGQGTAALELLEEVSDLDIVMAPLGGGGLLSGTTLATKGRDANIRVIGGEPEGANDGFRSFQTGVRVAENVPHTICDGLRTCLSERTFNIITGNTDAIVTATEDNVVRAMRLTWEDLKIVIEPSCCPPLAAIMEGKLDVRGKKVGIILTGGNVDLDKLPWQT
ncbi:MAG: threonine/serine dehydratase [Betaproteobacteria bacterium]|nr:threonine/serine dehydratase [Betaproteobacteria bacterium]